MSGVFNKGGNTVLSSGPSATLDGVGDVLRCQTVVANGLAKVNDVTFQTVLYLQIPFDATTVDVAGNVFLTRGSLR